MAEPKAGRKRAPIPTALRYAVWRHYCGDRLDGRCFCCQQPLRFEDWHCGHVIADARGGMPTLDNLRPVCKTCNWSMGVQDMRTYMASRLVPMEVEQETEAMEI